MKKFYYKTSMFPICSLIIDKSEKYAFAGKIQKLIVILGSTLGSLYIFTINEHIWTQIAVIFDHSNEITYISHSNILNALATSSLDGYVHLYLFPKNRMFRSIKLPENSTADYVKFQLIFYKQLIGIFNSKSITRSLCLFKNCKNVLLLFNQRRTYLF